MRIACLHVSSLCVFRLRSVERCCLVAAVSCVSIRVRGRSFSLELVRRSKNLRRLARKIIIYGLTVYLRPVCLFISHARLLGPLCPYYSIWWSVWVSRFAFGRAARRPPVQRRDGEPGNLSHTKTCRISSRRTGVELVHDRPKSHT